MQHLGAENPHILLKFERKIKILSTHKKFLFFFVGKSQLRALPTFSIDDAAESVDDVVMFFTPVSLVKMQPASTAAVNSQPVTRPSATTSAGGFGRLVRTVVVSCCSHKIFLKYPTLTSA